MSEKVGIAAELARLTVKVEVADTRSFGEEDFKLLVDQALGTVLGSCGPDFKVDNFNNTTSKGSVIAPGKDIQLIWAALSSFGSLFERRVAVHFNTLTEYEGEF